MLKESNISNVNQYSAGNSGGPTLCALGISKDNSSKFQKIALFSLVFGCLSVYIYNILSIAIIIADI